MSLTIYPNTYAGIRLRAFNSQVAINGTQLSFDGATIDALCPQKEQLREMQQANFLGRRDAQFMIRRTDYVTLGINDKSTVESVGAKFQVTSILDDDAEPTVDVRARLLQ